METTLPPIHARPLYPQSHAFVVQFESGPARPVPRAGRVEHIASGHALRFESVAELLEFVITELGALEDGAAPP
jgi:hypothetical protein